MDLGLWWYSAAESSGSSHYLLPQWGKVVEAGTSPVLPLGKAAMVPGSYGPLTSDLNWLSPTHSLKRLSTAELGNREEILSKAFVTHYSYEALIALKMQASTH